jgi:hypothetical protein
MSEIQHVNTTGYWLRTGHYVSDVTNGLSLVIRPYDLDLLAGRLCFNPSPMIISILEDSEERSSVRLQNSASASIKLGAKLSQELHMHILIVPEA